MRLPYTDSASLLHQVLQLLTEAHPASPPPLPVLPQNSLRQHPLNPLWVSNPHNNHERVKLTCGGMPIAQLHRSSPSHKPSTTSAAPQLISSRIHPQDTISLSGGCNAPAAANPAMVNLPATWGDHKSSAFCWRTVTDMGQQ